MRSTFKDVCLLFGIFILSVVFLYFIIVFVAESATPNASAPIDKTFYKTIVNLTDEVEKEWLQVMREGKIVKISADKYVGLAKKFSVIFESGHIGIAKLVDPVIILPKQWATTTEIPASPTYARSDRKFQAWPEVAANAVARTAFTVLKKPPAAIRKLDAQTVYGCEGCNSWSDYFNSKMKKDVYISVHSFMDSLHYSAPAVSIMEFLTLLPSPKKQIPLETRTAKDQDIIKAVSDVILFDTLIDDHDRKKSHNWMADGNGQLLLWDSGLSFQHGPFGKESCFNLLCGPEKWVEHGKNAFGKKKTCERICRFRNETVTSLRSLTKGANPFNPEKVLGNRVKADLEASGMPAFEMNVYYQFPRTKFPRTTFPTSFFYEGLNKRLEAIITHIDGCINKYGEEAVLM